MQTLLTSLQDLQSASVLICYSTDMLLHTILNSAVAAGFAAISVFV